MASPVSGAGGKALKLAVQQMQQMQQMQQEQNQQVQQGTSQFDKMLQTNQTNQPNQVNQAADAGKTRSMREVAGAQDSSKVNQVNKTEASRTDKLNAAKMDTAPKKLTQALEGMVAKGKELDKIIDQAIKGKKRFNMTELLALQKKVCDYSLQMDLTSKVVEKTTGGIKQAMNTQV